MVEVLSTGRTRDSPCTCGGPHGHFPLSTRVQSDKENADRLSRKFFTWLSQDLSASRLAAPGATILPQLTNKPDSNTLATVKPIRETIDPVLELPTLAKERAKERKKAGIKPVRQHKEVEEVYDDLGSDLSGLDGDLYFLSHDTYPDPIDYDEDHSKAAQMVKDWSWTSATATLFPGKRTAGPRPRCEQTDVGRARAGHRHGHDVGHPARQCHLGQRATINGNGASALDRIACANFGSTAPADAFITDCPAGAMAHLREHD